MIIDNADDAEMFFRPDKNDSQGSRYVSEPTTPTTLGQYIPDCHHGTILVTTRNKKAGIKLTRSQGMIQVVEMDELLSVDLVRKTLDVEDTQKDDIRDLVALLDYLPLALVQAAAYIQENSLSVRKYISMLSAGNRHVVKLLSENFEAFGRDSQIPNAVAATWMISFDHIRRIRPRAAGLLSLMAFLDRLSIPQDFLLDEDEDPLDDVFVKACADLKAFSLIVETPDGGNFNVHRLVQMITHKWLYDRGEVDLWAGKALQTVSSKYPSANDVKNWNVCANYLPHAQTILQQDSESGAEELLRLSLSSNVATYLWHQGRWTEAEKLGVDALEASKRVLGVEHPDTLTRMANLALTYSNQGRLAKAEKLGVDVLETSKRVLGVEHPDTLTRMANLALTYWNQGRWTEAEELGVDVLETSKRVLGVEHPDTLTRMANLASTYWNQGRWTEAEKLEVDVLETSKRVLGAEHPNTLTRMANLASTYLNQGRWTEAEELGVDVLETSKRVLGAEHPNTLTRMANLASTYWNQGRWTEAEELGVDVLETSKRVLGAEHPNTLTRMANLASTYRDQGRWTEAEKLEVDGLETSKRVLGVEHPNTLTKMANLALTYWDQGRWTEAEKLEVDVLETSKRVLGVEHPNTLTGMINLACTWKSQGRHEGAIDLLRKAERLRRNILGSDHYLATRTTQTLQEWEAWVEATGKPQEQGS
jgi:tetratricopeptide (TPR) repeat protein